MSIWLCSNDHEEICHEGKDCPICDKIRDLNWEIDKKDERIAELEEEIDKLKI